MKRLALAGALLAACAGPALANTSVPDIMAAAATHTAAADAPVVNLLGDLPLQAQTDRTLMGGIPISQLPNLSAAAASLTDAFAAQSASCTGGNCRITVAQILAAAGAGGAGNSVSTSSAAPTADIAQITGNLNGGTSLTAQYILNCSIASQGCGSKTFFISDGVRGVNVTNPLTAGMPELSSPFINAGVSGYVLNRSPMNGLLNPAVALNGFGACVADNTYCWGLNTLVSDNLGFTSSNGIGRKLFNELDLNITSPHTSGSVLQLGGTWLAAAAGVNGIFVAAPSDPNNTGASYANAIAIGNGAAFSGLTLGTSTRSAPGGSQAIVFPYWSSGGPEHTSSMYTTSDGTLVLQSDDAGNLDLLKGSVFLPSGHGILINNNPVFAADSGSNMFIGSGGSFQSIAVGNNSAGIFLNGPVVIATQTPGSSSGSCSTGQITYDYNYLYICPTSSHWRRIAASDF